MGRMWREHPAAFFLAKSPSWAAALIRNAIREAGLTLGEDYSNLYL